MEKFEKSFERPEAQKPETAIVKFWENIRKEAEDARKLTAENRIENWWRGAADTTKKSLAADESEATEPETEQSEESEGLEELEELEELIDQYYDDLKDNSEFPETIEVDDSSWERLFPEEIAEKRAEFNANKEKLIKEWEEKNGKTWPRYKEDVYVNGKLIRKAGDRYDAHHIKPLSFGGKNEAGNITPISADKHFDKQGVHSPTSPYGKIEKQTQGAKTA